MPRALSVLPLLAALSACGAPEEPQAAGRGLVILPYDGPLGPGVESRDPRLEFHDFGTVPDGDVVTRVFRLRNSDPREVAIQRVDPGCGCTVASLRVVHADGTVQAGESIRSKAEKLLSVPPGDVAELEVRIDTREIATKNSHKLITLRVLTDSPNGYFLSFEVHVFVDQPFAVVPAQLAFGNVPEGGGGTARVEIVPAPRRTHELRALQELPAGVQAELVKEIRNLMPVWVLTARLEAPLARGPRRETLRIATEEAPGVPGRVLEVPLSAEVVGDLLAEPQRIAFRAPLAGEASGSCELFSLLAGHRLRITAIEVPAEHREALAVRYEPVEADDDGTSKRWHITLATRPPLAGEGILSGALRVHLDDPQHPLHELEYVVHVR